MKKTISALLAFKILLLVISLNIGGNSTNYQAVEVAQAYEVIEEVREYIEPTDPCGLHTVICPGEEKVTRALQEIPHETQATADYIKYLYEYTEGTDVDPDEVARTIYCESMWYNIQSGYYKDGVQEDSHGIAQIHRPSHPTITLEQSYDQYFAIRFMVNRWHNVKWYGYDREKEECTNTLQEYWK